MKAPIHLLLLPAACLTGGWMLSMAWSRPSDSSGSAVAPASMEAVTANVGQNDDGKFRSAIGEEEDGLPVAALALAGLKSAPAIEDIFEVEGADRRLRLALFLQNADGTACQTVMDRLDPADALVPLANSGEAGDPLMDMVWDRWVEIDPASAISWNQGNSAVWSAWARVDAEAALAAAAGSPPRLAEVIRVVGQRDPTRAEALIAAHPELAGDGGIWKGMAENLAISDPAAAVALAWEKQAGWKEILTNWSAGNPKEAFTWAAGLEEGPQKRRSLETVIQEWTRADPAAGLNAARQLPPGHSAKVLTAQAIRGLAHQDPEAARKAAALLPDNMGRQAGVAALADGLKTSNPEMAFEVLRDIRWDALFNQQRMWIRYPDGGSAVEERHEGIPDFKDLVRHFAELNPQATAEVILPQAGIGEGTYALSLALGQWVQSAPEEASAWIRDLPSGDGRDTGIETLVNQLTVNETITDFSSAMAWAAEASPAKRQGFLEQVLSRWQSKDATAAAEAAARLGIPLSLLPGADPFSR